MRMPETAMSCYLCGAAHRLTKDHIPPKGFFPPPRPSNLITVPCCKTCNESYSKDDEAVRVWFSASLGRSSAGEWIYENKALTGTVAKSPAFREKMLSTMQDTKLLTEDGEIEAVRFTFPIDRVERFIVRCTKGLLRHYYPNYDYSNATFSVQHLLPRADVLKQLEPLRDLLAYDSRGEGVFQIRRGLTQSEQSGAWLLIFYEAVIFMVANTKNNFGVAVSP